MTALFPFAIQFVSMTFSSKSIDNTLERMKKNNSIRARFLALLRVMNMNMLISFTIVFAFILHLWQTLVYYISTLCDVVRFKNTLSVWERQRGKEVEGDMWWKFQTVRFSMLFTPCICCDVIVACVYVCYCASMNWSVIRCHFSRPTSIHCMFVAATKIHTKTHIHTHIAKIYVKIDNYWRVYQIWRQMKWIMLFAIGI